MTLVELAKELNERSIRRRMRDEREGEARTIRARTTNLGQWLAKVRLLHGRNAVLMKHGFDSGGAIAPPIDQFAAYGAVEDGSAEPRFRQSDWDSAIRAIKVFVEKLEGRFKGGIEEAKESLLGGVTAEDIRGYASDPSTREKAEDLLADFAALKVFNWTAPAPHELDAQLTNAKRFVDEFRVLREEGASESLREFLADARGEDGALLSRLTPELQRELEARRILSRLRLVIK